MRLILSLYFALFLFKSANSQVYPIVKGFGGIYEVKNADEYPDPTIQYKIVVDIKYPVKNSELNDALNNLARMINLHGVGGVPAENLDVVAVLHGASANSALNNSAFKRKFGIENPNTAIIQALSDSGVKFFICGQSMRARGITEPDLNENVKISLSALTIVTTYQLKGYALLSFY